MRVYRQAIVSANTQWVVFIKSAQDPVTLKRFGLKCNFLVLTRQCVDIVSLTVQSCSPLDVQHVTQLMSLGQLDSFKTFDWCLCQPRPNRQVAVDLFSACMFWYNLKACIKVANVCEI